MQYTTLKETFLGIRLRKLPTSPVCVNGQTLANKSTTQRVNCVNAKAQKGLIKIKLAHGRDAEEPIRARWDGDGDGDDMAHKTLDYL